MTSFFHDPSIWVIFNVIVAILLAFDLGIFHRKSQELSYAQALTMSFIWIALALLFSLWLTMAHGKEMGILFLTGYAIEKSLSLDNIMVIAIIFETLKIPLSYQYRVLFWGIIGALSLRFIMIWGGVVLIQKFHFLIFLFGLLMIITGLKIIFLKKNQENLSHSNTWKMIQRILPITDQYKGKNFFTKQGEKVYATPLLVALIWIEFSDIVFAVDSIPAIFSITQEPFLIYTSNVFAILGLRSLYFVLPKVITNLRFLKKGLGLVVIFIGLKMIGIIKVEVLTFLLIVLTTLGASSLASWKTRYKI